MYNTSILRHFQCVSSLSSLRCCIPLCMFVWSCEDSFFSIVYTCKSVCDIFLFFLASFFGGIVDRLMQMPSNVQETGLESNLHTLAKFCLIFNQFLLVLTSALASGHSQSMTLAGPLHFVWKRDVVQCRQVRRCWLRQIKALQKLASLQCPLQLKTRLSFRYCPVFLPNWSLRSRACSWERVSDYRVYSKISGTGQTWIRYNPAFVCQKIVAKFVN